MKIELFPMFCVDVNCEHMEQVSSIMEIEPCKQNITLQVVKSFECYCRKKSAQLTKRLFLRDIILFNHSCEFSVMFLIFRGLRDDLRLRLAIEKRRL